MKQAYSILYNKNKIISGIIIFTKLKKNMKIYVKIFDNVLSKGMHGFHIHEYDDKNNNCYKMGDHFNPNNKDHGGHNNSERHIGDFGNIKINKKGGIEFIFYDKYVDFKGKYNILNRGVVIHQKKDDLGLKNNLLSKKTGNSGKRILCGSILFKTI